MLKWSYRSEIWPAPRQHCCRDACQISERPDFVVPVSRGFETSRDLVVGRLMAQRVAAWVVSRTDEWPSCQCIMNVSDHQNCGTWLHHLVLTSCLFYRTTTGHIYWDIRGIICYFTLSSDSICILFPYRFSKMHCKYRLDCLTNNFTSNREHRLWKVDGKLTKITKSHKICIDIIQNMPKALILDSQIN